MHIAGDPVTSEVPLEVRPPRRHAANPPVRPGPPNLHARARGQVVPPPAPRQAVGVGQAQAPQPVPQVPPVAGGAQAAPQVPPVAGPRVNPPRGQNPGMANPQARLQQDIAQLVQALTQMANQGQIQGQPQQRGFHTATLLPRDAFSGLDMALARAHWANFQGSPLVDLTARHKNICIGYRTAAPNSVDCHRRVTAGLLQGDRRTLISIHFDCRLHTYTDRTVGFHTDLFCVQALQRLQIELLHSVHYCPLLVTLPTHSQKSNDFVLPKSCSISFHFKKNNAHCFTLLASIIEWYSV